MASDTSENKQAASGLQPRTALGTTNAECKFSFPEPLTVKGQVLADLLLGRRITHRDTWIEHGSSRLAHHIFVLKETGWPVCRDDIQVETSDGRWATIGQYRLPAETIREAGERGRRFVEQARRGQ